MKNNIFTFKHSQIRGSGVLYQWCLGILSETMGKKRVDSKPWGVLCKRIGGLVKENKILAVTMATFMDKEEHEAFWSLLLLYLNIYWLAASVESGIINFFSGGTNKWRWGFPEGKPGQSKEF